MDRNIKNGCDTTQNNGTQPQTSQDEVVLQPFTYITEIFAHDTFRELAKAFNFWLNVPEDKFKEIDDSYRRIYYADLLLDDIRDSATLRGGKKCAHLVYSMPCTLNAACYARETASATLACLDHPQAAVLVTEQVEEYCIARWLELHWRDTLTSPSEEEYYQMIIKKTHGLLTTEIKLLQLFSTNQDDFTKLLRIFGLYFQILGDYHRLNADDESENETYCEDITLGKFSLPIIYAINESQPNESEKILATLRQRIKQKEVKNYFLSVLENVGSFKYAKTILTELREAALNELKKLGNNPIMENFIEKYLNPSRNGHILETENGTHPEKENTASTNISLYVNHVVEMQCETKLKEDYIKRLLKPYTHICGTSSESKMNIFGVLIGLLKTIPEDKIKILSKILNYGYHSSNVLDDIQDRSVLRRGIPCAYVLYGIPNTVNAVIYIGSLYLRLALELQHPQAVKFLYEGTLSMYRGQGMELYWRENFICPTEEQYCEMIIQKSGGAFYMVENIMSLFATREMKISSAAMRNIILWYQINDDYQNLNNQVYHEAKGFCDDLSEGKFSLPIIHAIKTHPKEGKIIMNILSERTQDIERKKYCLSLLEKCGSFEYTANKMLEFKRKIEEEADPGIVIIITMFMQNHVNFKF